MQTKMTQEHKLMAWVLNKEFYYTMTSIASLMKVSQSTISMAVKEVEYWKTINDLSNELAEARATISQYGLPYNNEPQLYIE